MRVLLIKTSSMGDIIHTLPALTDASLALPSVRFDWVVEEPFAEIPSWHKQVDNVIPVALRRWRKDIFSRATLSGIKQFRSQLKDKKYDLILDAQGLVKSAWLVYLARGVRAGLDFSSAREGLASLAYQRRYTVNFHQHAIHRMRQLCSQALGYALPETPPDFGLQVNKTIANDPYLVFLHGTTWKSKQWPEVYWQELAELAKLAGYRIKVGGGNKEEVERATRLASKNSAIDLVPYLSINEMAQLLSGAKAAVAVDTGFGHLASALNIPTVSLYSSTNADFTGALGHASTHLSADFECAPCLQRECTFKGNADITPACFTRLPPLKVWHALQALW